jgi:hypothetical protein
MQLMQYKLLVLLTETAAAYTAGDVGGATPAASLLGPV